MSFFFVVQFTCGQNSYKLSGTVKNAASNPVEIADVLLLKPTDSSVVKYTYVYKGAFILEDIKQGYYLLKVSSLGYKQETFAVDVNSDKNIDIVLEEDIQSLDIVVVKGERRLFENSSGNIKANIENTVLGALPNPVDIMVNIPTLQVSPDRETISVVGRGIALIYLDKQRISSSQLNTLAVDNIKSIEIINNPSAKYEADGRSVILIETKKNEANGSKVSLSETTSFKRFFNNYAAVNASFKKDKFEFKVNFGYNALLRREELESDYNITDRDLFVENYTLSDAVKPEFIIGGGVYYEINSGDYASLNVNSNFFDADTDIMSRSFIQDVNIDNVITLSDTNDDRFFINSNFNYNNKINDNSNLFFGFQYTKFDQNTDSFIDTNENESGFIPTQFRIQDFNIESYSGRLDYEVNFEKGTKLELGVNTSISNSNTQQNIEDFVTSTNSSNTDYTYEEKINAIYSSLKGKLSEKINYSIGLRVENYNAEGAFEGAPLLIDRNQTNFFPRTNLIFTLDSTSTKTLQLNYARSITRPNFTNLSQVEVYVSPSITFSRNINLLPTLMNEVSVTYASKGSSLALTYYHYNDPVHLTTLYDESEDVFNNTWINFEKETGFSLSLSYPQKITSFWSSVNILNLIYNNIEDPRVESSNSSPYLYYYSNHKFSIPGDLSLAITGWGYTDRDEGAIQRNSLLVMNATLSKTIFKNISCTIGYNDIFKGLTFEDVTTINTAQSRNRFIVDSREFFVALKYSFGNIKKSSYRNKKINEEDNRIR